MISQTTEYALRAVVWLASHPGQSLTASQIAERTFVPAGYLSKVLQGLSRAALLKSQRGLGGGFTLARRPEDITIWDVVQAVDPIERIRSCPLKLTAHTGGLCRLHSTLDGAIAMIEQALTSCRLSELIDRDVDRAPLCAFEPTKARKSAPVKLLRRGK